MRETEYSQVSSNIFVLDDPSFKHSTSNMLHTDVSDTFFLEISDSIETLLQEISSDDQYPNISQPLTAQNPAQETNKFDLISHTLFSNSPPSHQFETLSLSQQHQKQQENQTHSANLQNSSILASGYENHSVSEIKTEDFHLGFLFQTQSSFDALLEEQKFKGMSSGGQIRRVCSTGNLPDSRLNEMAERRARGGGGERNFIEEANFQVGRYSAEERKERIDRYRAKRTQRNFNKTIKYVCRKTLADSRPRIRGRFARNDETGEVDGSLQEDDEEGILGKEGGGRFLSSFGGTHCHY